MQINLPEKRYYSIGEIAKALNVNASLLRFWDQEFDVIQPKKNAKGNRQFTPKDVENIQKIFHLVKERGFTIEGAKQQLKVEAKNSKKPIDIITKLQHIKQQLIEIKNQI